MLMGVLSHSRILYCHGSKINRINEQFKLSITLTQLSILQFIKNMFKTSILYIQTHAVVVLNYSATTIHNT